MRKIYLVGSLRDEDTPGLAIRLREDGHEVFDEWFSAGPIADDSWQKHQTAKGVSFREALRGPAAQHVLAFDDAWLLWADTVVMVGPGKSRGIELGVSIGRGKEGFIYLPDGEPERWDVMYGYARDVVFTEADLRTALKEELRGRMDVSRHAGYPVPVADRSSPQTVRGVASSPFAGYSDVPPKAY